MVKHHNLIFHVPRRFFLETNERQ